MENQKLDMFLMTNAKFFSEEKLGVVRDMLSTADDSKSFAIQTASYKDPTTLLIVSILAGSLGVDRFMLGETGLGIAKLLTCGGMGIWTIVDWFMIMNKTKDANFAKLTNILQ
jgi:TM2 domain-containing membrane protein YozV